MDWTACSTKRWVEFSLVLCLTGSAAWATDLHVNVTSGGLSSVTVAPGATVDYDVTAELSDTLNEGLSLILFDLSFSGGALAQANEPTTLPMTNFDRPLGATNPAGYGGTVVGGSLVQLCGAQNTIKNDVGNAAFPTGSVMTGIASPDNPVVVLSGSLTAPMTEGPYLLSLSNLAASVIRDGEDGSGAFWAVDLANPGTINHLSVTVQVPSPGVPTVDAVGARYLAISPDATQSDPVAFFVTPTCAGGAGQYVGAPSGPYNVATMLVGDPQTPTFLTPAAWGPTVYVTGLHVIPNTEFGIQADAGTAGNPNLLAPVNATTWLWGDANNLSGVDLDDILCVLDAFGSLFNCSLYGTDLLGFTPDQNIDIDDILAVLDAFGATPYPGPSPCP